MVVEENVLSSAPQHPDAWREAESQLENGPKSSQEKSAAESSSSSSDGELDFTDPQDPENPFNWSKKRKWTIVMLISTMSTINTVATLTCTPAVPQILADLHSTNVSYSTLLVSIWELGEGIGPFFVGPLSEHYGRLPVWHVCTGLFALCSVACALSVNASMLVAFRFLNGFVVASITLSPTIISDMFRPEERATAIAIVSMMPMIGPSVGPIIGSYVAHGIGWRWVFWVIAIAVVLFEIPSILVLRETYKVKILERRAAKARGDSHAQVAKPRFPFHILLRAFKIWIFLPVVFVLALFLAMCYGYQYLVFTTLTEVLEGQYSFSTDIVGVAFVGIGLGSVLGMFAVGKGSDWYVKKKKAQRGHLRPEDRIPPVAIGTVIMAAGLFMYGWGAQQKVQWMLPIVGSSVQGFGLAVVLISTQTYMVDSFPVHAASGSAAASILRSIAGAVVPLAGPPLYSTLGLGWGNSLLAFTALAFLPVPLAMVKYGVKSRERAERLNL